MANYILVALRLSRNNDKMFRCERNVLMPVLSHLKYYRWHSARLFEQQWGKGVEVEAPVSPYVTAV